MKRFVLGIAAVVFIHFCQAQSRTFNTDWNDGAVVFTTNDTVTCQLRYNHTIPVGILQVKKGDLAITVAPEDVKSFQFYDAHRDRTRRFLALKVDGHDDVPAVAFMECLYFGARVSILNHKTVGLPRDYMSYTWFVSKPARLNRRYIFDRETGELLPMSRQNALRLLDDHQAEVSAYVDNQRIRFKSVSDYISVFEFHKSL